MHLKYLKFNHRTWVIDFNNFVARIDKIVKISKFWLFENIIRTSNPYELESVMQRYYCQYLGFGSGSVERKNEIFLILCLKKFVHLKD